MRGSSPEIALVLLGYIGGKMLWEGLRGGEETGAAASALTLGAVMMQGVATSIDALSVGFTIAEYGLAMALVCAALIAAVTFVLCYAGIGIGKKIRHQAGRQGVCAGRRDPHRHRAGEFCDRGVLSQNKKDPRCLLGKTAAGGSVFCGEIKGETPRAIPAQIDGSK